MILLPLPKVLTARFLVVAPETGWRDSPAVAVSDLTIEEVGPGDPRVRDVAELLCCGDCSPGLGPLLPLLETSGHLLVSCTSVPGWPMTHLWAGASAAEALVSARGGTPLDAGTARPLSPAHNPERLREARSRAVPSPYFSDFVIAPWIRITQETAAAGIALSTRGLNRLGLPELRVFAVGQVHLAVWTNTIHGLARALLTRQLAGITANPARASYLLPAELTVTAADVAAALSPSAGPADGLDGDVGSEGACVSQEPSGGGVGWWREVGLRYEVLRDGRQYLNVQALDELD
ncbi:hypothetical protein Aph01nite_70240 [Acrocarpospora phusangensis]|uniref:Uncharacterized protein n=1 Tax=Acrocarpospora phusangensis TaxID=1070424 RepID=A0A919UPC4_9ACTN|nr:hypothetical protein [Acrocarpospora phusangensis]GIH28714.1 hypothetical protein Aph01nite_70240 [Acrocarpospora phusangensis]